jgi:hypothetical protein
MATTLLILHGLVAVALLGAITHQAISAWLHSRSPPRTFVGRFRSVRAAAFTNAIVVLYVASTLMGAAIYLLFKVDVQPVLERDHHWHAMGFFDLKEDFVAIGLGLLPAYWVCWRHSSEYERGMTRPVLTVLLAFIVWWSFLVGHVLNNIMGFGG